MAQPSPDAGHAPGAASRRAPRRWRTRLGLVTLGIALPLLLGESIARLAGVGLRPHMRNRVYFTEPDPQLGWRNRAGVSGPYAGDHFRTWVTINAAGQRGPLHDEARAAGTKRIAVLGDSQAWGDGVGDAESFAALLDGGRVEVLNFSCLGYGTDQELLVLDAQAAAYRPDIVLIAAFVGNDIFDNLSQGTYQYPKPYFVGDPDGQLELRGVPVPIPRLLHAGVEVYRGVVRHSRLLNALADLASAPPEAKPGVPLAQQGEAELLAQPYYGREPRPQDVRGLALMSRLIADIAHRARELGAEPILLIIPEMWQVKVANDPAMRRRLREIGADWRRPQRVLERELAGKIRVIDALPTLARASRRLPQLSGPEYAPTYIQGWRHLNAHGHAAIARLLERRLHLRRARREGAAPRERPDEAEGQPLASASERSTARRGSVTTASAASTAP